MDRAGSVLCMVMQFNCKFYGIGDDMAKNLPFPPHPLPKGA